MLTVLKNEEVAKIQYDREKGFYLENFYFDSLIEIEDCYLPVERSIHMSEDKAITWTLSAGWIVVRIVDNHFDYCTFTTLADYLNQRFNSAIEQEPMKTMKEEFIDEFIAQLKDRLTVITDYLQQKRFVSPDELLFILKEHKQPNTQSFIELKGLLEKELANWYAAKRKLIEFGIFESTVFIPIMNKREELSN